MLRRFFKKPIEFFWLSKNFYKRPEASPPNYALKKTVYYLQKIISISTRQSAEDSSWIHQLGKLTIVH